MLPFRRECRLWHGQKDAPQDINDFFNFIIIDHFEYMINRFCYNVICLLFELVFESLIVFRSSMRSFLLIPPTKPQLSGQEKLSLN